MHHAAFSLCLCKMGQAQHGVTTLNMLQQNGSALSRLQADLSHSNIMCSFTVQQIDLRLFLFR